MSWILGQSISIEDLDELPRGSTVHRVPEGWWIIEELGVEPDIAELANVLFDELYTVWDIDHDSCVGIARSLHEQGYRK